MVSHSPAEVIQRHYSAHPWAEQIQPDLVLGWDQERHRMTAMDGFDFTDLAGEAKDDKKHHLSSISILVFTWKQTLQPFCDYFFADSFCHCRMQADESLRAST